MSEVVAIGRLDRAVDRLGEIAAPYGLAFPPAEPEQLEMLVTVERTVAPFRLPADIGHFYRTWSVSRSGLLFAPELCDLSFALDTWSENRESEWPSTALFPIAYSSHWFHLVELEHPGTLGPFIYDAAYAGGRFTLVHACLAGWLEWIAESVSAGRIEEVWQGAWQLSRERSDEERVATLRAEDVPEAEIPWFDDADRTAWPLRWNLADGLDPGDYELRGATHTLASFVDALRDGPASATIQVVVLKQMGHTAELADETGCLAVSLVRQSPPFGSGSVWEVEITGEHQPELEVLPFPTPEEPPQFDLSRQDDQEYLAGYAAAAARRMALRADPVAHVTFIRPIDVTGSDAPEEPPGD